MCSGRMGASPGFYANRDAVTEDNDGEIEDAYYSGLIDLSEVLSKQLGKQMPMMATYRISYLQVDLRNKNNAIDNNANAFFGGVFQWYTPTKDRVNALQALRSVDRAINTHDDSGQSGSHMLPFQTGSAEKPYRGLRFGFHAPGSQVTDPDSNELTSIMNGANYYMTETFDHYNIAQAGTPSGEGRPSSGDGRALWETRTAHETTGRDSVYWVTSMKNRLVTTGGQPDTSDSYSEPWCMDLGGDRHIDVLGGLLHLDLTHSNIDTYGIAEDEFHIQVTVGVDGWSEF